MENKPTEEQYIDIFNLAHLYSMVDIMNRIYADTDIIDEDEFNKIRVKIYNWMLRHQDKVQ